MCLLPSLGQCDNRLSCGKGRNIWCRTCSGEGCFWSSAIIRECNSRSCFQMTNIAFVIFNAQQLLSMESPMKERRIDNFVSSLRTVGWQTQFRKFWFFQPNFFQMLGHMLVENRQKLLGFWLFTFGAIGVFLNPVFGWKPNFYLICIILLVKKSTFQ